MQQRRKTRRIHYYSNTPTHGYATSSVHPVAAYFRSRILVLIGAVAAVVVVTCGVFVFLNNPFGNAQQANSVTADSEKHEEKPPPPPPINDSELSSQIQQVLSANPQLDIGVSVKDLATGQTYTYGVDKQFIAASVGKLLTASLYLKNVEDGTYTLDDTIGDTTSRAQIQKMIGQSDNTAWKLLNDLMGHPALEEYARSIGITSYDATDNKIKPSDVSLLLGKLYNHELLDEDHTRFLLANMQQDQEEVQFIRRYIDPSISVYHKAGWLSDRAHDTAIVENPGRPYVLVIFTKARYGDYDFQKGQEIFSSLTTATQSIMQK